MAHGGARTGAGRKRNPGKQMARITAEAEAEQFLNEINWKEDLKRIYDNCPDADTKLRIILAMQARAWGKVDPKGKKSDPNGDSITASSTERLAELLAGAVRQAARVPKSERPN